jgi:hypothetical protein
VGRMAKPATAWRMGITRPRLASPRLPNVTRRHVLMSQSISGRLAIR